MQHAQHPNERKGDGVGENGEKVKIAAAKDMSPRKQEKRMEK